MLLTAACGRFTVNEHVAATDGMPPLRRILLVSRLGDAGGNPLADSFHAALLSRFAACGMETRLETPDAMAIDGNQKLAALIRSFNPDSILLIRQTVRVNGSPVDGNFVFTLHSQTEKRDLWKASASLTAPVGSSREFGAEAAAALVRTMAADGALRACPNAAA